MKESTKLLIRVLTGFELVDRWEAFCLGVDVDELRKRREQYTVAQKVAYYTGIAVVIVAVVVTVVMQFRYRHGF